MRRPSFRSSVVPFLLLAAACHEQTDDSADTTRVAQAAIGGQVTSAQAAARVAVRPEALTTRNYWSYFVGTWQDPAFAGYVKFSLVLDEAGAIQGLVWHPSKYRYHAEHLATLPEFAGMTPAEIDRIALRTQGRRLLLGTMLVPKGSDLRTSTNLQIQLMSQDPLPAADVARAFGALAPELPQTSSTLQYFPVPEQVAYVAAHGAEFTAASVPLAESKTEGRICYTSGWGVGRVRIVHRDAIDAEVRAGRITQDDIVVLDEVPRELPAVAGIVVAATSSPSSHPALLASMLGIPFVYEKDATTLERWVALAAQGTPVYVQSQGDERGGCELLVRDGASLTPAEAGQLAELKKPLPVAVAMYDAVAEATLDFDVLGMGDTAKVGAKAANVAELRRVIPGNTVERGLALPMQAFGRFLAEATTDSGAPLRPAYDALLTRLLTPGISFAETVDGLDGLRTLLEKAKLPAGLETDILAGITAKFPAGTRVKLRSSSNVEDKPEFNGAGLYESKGACVGDDALPKPATSLCTARGENAKRDPVIGAVKKVWASLYTYKAWVVRRTFGVDEAHTGMGVLVQPSFVGEVANGVLLSSIPEYAFDPQDPSAGLAVTVNGFPGEDDSVTNPPAGKVPETTRVTERGAELLVASTELPRGRSLLTDAQYAELFTLVKAIHAHYVAHGNVRDPAAFKLDLEWKLELRDGAPHLVIKQVRQVPTRNNSTQGFGRGTFVIGEHGAKLCPTTRENLDALTKLRLTLPLTIDLALHELPLALPSSDTASALPSPLRSVVSAGALGGIGATAALTYESWSALWGTTNERRSYTLTTPFTLGARSLAFRFEGEQTRSLVEPQVLLDGVRTLWATGAELVEGDTSQAYAVVLGDHACEADAYQGFQPGSALGGSTYGVQRKAPYAGSEEFAAADGSALHLSFAGRTAFQGFDKTRFLHIDEAVVEGILPRALRITRPLAAVYAPGHHNFTFGYALDATADDSLTVDERAELARRGIRYVVLESGNLDEQVQTVSTVDEAGTKTPVGSVRLTNRAAPGPL